MKTAIAIFGMLALSGCMSMGIQGMTPAQLKAAEGLLTCDNITSIYANANSVTVHMEALKKGSDAASKITVSRMCDVTIEMASESAK